MSKQVFYLTIRPNRWQNLCFLSLYKCTLPHSWPWQNPTRNIREPSFLTISSWSQNCFIHQLRKCCSCAVIILRQAFKKYLLVSYRKAFRFSNGMRKQDIFRHWTKTMAIVPKRPCAVWPIQTSLKPQGSAP